MRFLASIFLFTTLSFISRIPLVQAVATPSQQFCSTVRDKYIEEEHRRVQTQHYEGYSKGRGGVGVFSGVGAGGGAEFGYDWQRAWNNFDASKKREYESKNCDEVLRQWGRVSVEEIRADTEKAIGKMKLEEAKYSEDTKRILKQIDFEATKVHYQTLARIEELRQAGKIEEVKILADSGEKLLKIQEQGQTERLSIETNALVAMNQANNIVELKKAQLDASVKKQQSLTDLFKQGLISYFELEKEKEITRREIKKLELEIAKLEVQNRPQAQVDSNLALIKNWGLTTVSCSTASQVVIIMIDSKQYCTNPVNGLSAGSYTYLRNEDRLEPLSQQQNPISNPQLNPESSI